MIRDGFIAQLLAGRLHEDREEHPARPARARVAQKIAGSKLRKGASDDDYIKASSRGGKPTSQANFRNVFNRDEREQRVREAMAAR